MGDEMIYASRFLRLTHPHLEGPDIRALQEYLKSGSYYPGSPDGVFDPKTEKALQDFQKARHIPADGVAAPDTWLALNNDPVPPLSFSNPTAADTRITIDVDLRRLYFESPQLTEDYPVAVGKPSTPSPLGNWTIVQKVINPGGPFGTRWMRLSVPWGGYGIHGTNRPSSIGKAVSHGCIRMYNHDVEEIYPLTPLGTPVSIVGKANIQRVLQYHSRGDDVRKIQAIMQRLGLYKGRKDGYFGRMTRRAVIRFQIDHGLPGDGVVGSRTSIALVKAVDLANNDVNP